MSYRRSFEKRIAVHYSGSVSYPASQSGGSVSYSGTAYENVQVNIEVETTPFDNSVVLCNNVVNTLTGTVVATQTAQVASIDSNARKIGHTIVSGFFKTIRSEISQQIMELSTRIDATLVHLHEMAKRCVAKQKQMEADYRMLSERYLKIFTDLNNELSNRIHELDKPAFAFKRQIDAQDQRSLGSDLASTIAVAGAENGDMQARISASVLKKRALDTIKQANVFLVKQKCLNDTINRSMLKDNVSAVHYSPVCFVETNNEKSQINTAVYRTCFLEGVSDQGIISDFQTKKWNDFSKEDGEHIGRYFNQEINRCYPGADVHSSRVKENIVKLLNFNHIKSI